MYQFQPNFASITIARSGTLLPINPSLNIFEGNTVVFDLSDSSLSSVNLSTRYSAFDMNLYRDSNLTDRFDGSLTDNQFEVTKTGKVGIDTTAKLTLGVSKDVPENLFYEFSVVNSDFIESVKKEIVIDREVDGFNKIDKVDSAYDGEFKLTGATSSTFKYDIDTLAEKSSYSTDAGLSYVTGSSAAYVGIAIIDITFKGSNYKVIVGVSNVVGIVTGTGAVLEPSSNTIGRILSTKIENIGFNYPTDFTIRPTTNLPEVLLLESLTSFEEIELVLLEETITLHPTWLCLTD